MAALANHVKDKIMELPSLASDCLRDKVILVTGSGDGIGRAVAKSLASHQATIILLGKTTGKLESVYDEIEAANDPTPAIFPMDLSGVSEHDMQELIISIDKTFGRLDGIVHNAAYFEALTPFTEISSELWFKTIQVNLNAPFLITRSALPLLKRAKNASIIFTTDDVSTKGKAYWGAFCASKFAIEGMAQVLSEELENTPIRVNRLNPRQVSTHMMHRIFPGETAHKFKPASDITSNYVYLMSDLSKEIRGQSIILD